MEEVRPQHAVAEALTRYKEVPSVEQQKQAVEVLKKNLADFDKNDPAACGD